jgi:hypothetical protein
LKIGLGRKWLRRLEGKPTQPCFGILWPSRDSPIDEAVEEELSWLRPATQVIPDARCRSICKDKGRVSKTSAGTIEITVNMAVEQVDDAFSSAPVRIDPPVLSKNDPRVYS